MKPLQIALLGIAMVFLLQTIFSHPILSKKLRADDKHAPLRGELVPSSYNHPTHLAYDCFYGPNPKELLLVAMVHVAYCWNKPQRSIP